jgi:hypothetical protein
MRGLAIPPRHFWLGRLRGIEFRPAPWVKIVALVEQ